MRESIKPSATVSVAWFLILAALLHTLLLLTPVPPPPTYNASDYRNAKRPVEIERYDDKANDRNRTVVQSSKAAKQKAEDKKKAARFAGEFEQRVEKETKSVVRGKFQQGITPAGRPDAGGKNGDMAKNEPPATPNETGDVPGQDKKPPGQPGEKGLGGIGMRDLLAFGRSPNALPDDIASGNETVLNTDHVRYASFINRIADEIYDPWVKFARNAVEVIYGEGRKLEANTYITKLGVIMDTKGAVSEIKILESSGVPELDDAPKKAFWEVEPFPNPPLQMFQKEDTIRFVYEFHFEWKTASFNIVPWKI